VSTLAEIDRLMQTDRSTDALAMIETLWRPDELSAARHHALASRAMVASYALADYDAALIWLERTRKYAGSEVQPYLGLLAAAFQRLDAR
jgi:hypothetical protein